MQKITKKTELATTLRLIAKYCENSGCEILSWYNPTYKLVSEINQSCCSENNKKMEYVKEHEAEIKRIINIASERLNLEPFETITLSIIYSTQHTFSTEEYVNFFNITDLDVYDITNINNNLIYKGYFYLTPTNGWRLLDEMRSLIDKNSKEIKPVAFSRLRMICLLGRFVSSPQRTETSTADIIIINENLLSNDKFIKFLRRNIFSHERLLIYYLLYLTETTYEYKWELIKILEKVYGRDTTTQIRSRAETFINGTAQTIQEGLVEVIPNEDDEFSPMIRISDKCAELYYGDLYDGYKKRIEAYATDSNKSTITIKSDTIKEKVLYYNDENKSDIDFLYKSMDDNNLTQLKQRLEKHNLPNGICAILYGAPGTGKTETVMQIARECKRDIYHVDIAESKSMWFGESEKKIKKIFTTYQSLCQKARNLGNNLPILLFNEADSIFSKRKDVTVGNVAQTENTMQNILLEEMEKLDGILIATTNLIDNLDAAFERRFLFKVKLDKPSVENKMKIWANKVEGLEEPQYRKLAEQFDFSGGEIENVARKIIMQDVLYGKLPEFDRILEFCKTEKLSSAKNAVIGFRNN